MVDDGGEMLDRLIIVAKVQRIETALQQKVQRGRPGFAPFDPDFRFDPARLTRFGGQQAGEKIVEFPGIFGLGGTSKENQHKCRNDVIEKDGLDPHKVKGNRSAQECQCRPGHEGETDERNDRCSREGAVCKTLGRL